MIATHQLPRMRTKTTTIKTRLLWTALLALLLAPTAAEAQTEEVVFYHTDAIGSVRMITDATGAVLARYDFAPFGEKWDPQPDPDRLQFAGKERDTETGLDYFGARYYRDVSGRFTSVDPLMDVTQSLTDPQRWNRYAYSLNNPLKFIDPDGRSATLIGGLLGGAIGGGIALVQGRSWREVAASAAGGAASGAIFGSVVDTFGATLPVAIGGGALAGVGGVVTENAIQGHGTSVGEALISASMGALGGGIGAATGNLVSASKSFFAGSRYTAKVQKQMSQGDYHAFPESVTAFESSGRSFRRSGADGVERLWLEIPGAYKGKDGVFQFIKESSGEINHRVFVPYR